MDWGKMLERLLAKLTSGKVLLAAAVLLVVCLVELPDNSVEIVKTLIFAVYGAKAVQYGAEAVSKFRKESGDDGD